MLSRKPGIVSTLLFCAAMPAYLGYTPSASGMAPCGRPGKPCNKQTSCNKCGKSACKKNCDKQVKAEPIRETRSEMMSDLPPNDVEGECYAKVFVPAQYSTATERVLTREASETIEIIPAEYKWVEERRMTKEASTELVQVPAEYKSQERTITTKSGYTGWVMEKTTRCLPQDKAQVRDVFCLVSTPPVTQTITTQCLVKPASVRKVCIDAQYETVRREVVASPARTKKTCIAAEYSDVEKTVLVAQASVKWEHIICENKTTAATVNQVKEALTKAGFQPGPSDGTLAAQDWTALAQFQQKNGLGVGELSYETLAKLGVSAPMTATR